MFFVKYLLLRRDKKNRDDATAFLKWCNQATLDLYMQVDFTTVVLHIKDENLTMFCVVAKLINMEDTISLCFGEFLLFLSS